ncbi:branched-chain-amino-acid transaminase [Aureococcus anophagefferens]|nr:branched-chain-amino-acid transaminase [Aureococcus anophagefferens]
MHVMSSAIHYGQGVYEGAKAHHCADGERGAMYIRPYIFGHGPQLGLSPAPTFSFCVLAIPVSSYSRGGLKPIDVLVADGYDRAAPQGVGNVKASGNYGSDILVTLNARATRGALFGRQGEEDKVYEYGSIDNVGGSTATAIQFGEAPDAFGWGSVVPPLPDAAA